MLLSTLLLTTSAAAHDDSMVQGFAEGFTFHSHFAGNRRINPDGAVVYWRDGGGNTHIASVRQADAPCVFLSLGAAEDALQMELSAEAHALPGIRD